MLRFLARMRRPFKRAKNNWSTFSASKAPKKKISALQRHKRVTRKSTVSPIDYDDDDPARSAVCRNQKEGNKPVPARYD